MWPYRVFVHFLFCVGLCRCLCLECTRYVHVSVFSAYIAIVHSQHLKTWKEETRSARKSDRRCFPALWPQALKILTRSFGSRVMLTSEASISWAARIFLKICRKHLLSHRSGPSQPHITSHRNSNPARNLLLPKSGCMLYTLFHRRIHLWEEYSLLLEAVRLSKTASTKNYKKHARIHARIMAMQVQ